MKKLLIVLCTLMCSAIAFSQNLGVGVNSPLEKLDIDGALRLGTTFSSHAGTIRWNPDRNDFEGYNGQSWVSLTGSQGSWGQQDIFSYEDSGTGFMVWHANNEYGSKLGFALDADDNHIFAGAYDDYSPLGVPWAGRIYVIAKEQQVWNTFPYYSYSSPTPGINEWFGFSIDKSANFLMVGAPGWSNEKGRALMYTTNANGELALNSTLTVPDAAADDFLGGSVSMTDDYAFAGARNRDVAGVANAGRVSIFKRNTNTNVFALFNNIVAPDPDANDGFGSKVSASGIYLSVGAPSKTINGLVNQGRVYMYQLSGNAWVHMQTITAPDPSALDEFGECVYLRGDTLLIGARQINSPLPDHQGKVYYYLRNGQDWIFQDVIVAPDGQWRAAFGSSIYMKNKELIIGAPRARIGLNGETGKAYLYALKGNNWIHQTIVSASNRSPGDNFGQSVVLSGQSAIVGAPYSQVLEVPDNGRLYYFYK